MKKTLPFLLCSFLSVMILGGFSACKWSTPPPSDTSAYARADSATTKCKDIPAAEQLLKAYTKSGNRTGMMLVYKVLGKKYRENNQFFDAIRTHRKGLEIAQELSDTIEMIRALNNLGTNHRRIGVLDEAAFFHYQALLYCNLYSRKDRKTKKNRVISLNGIGNVMLTLNNYEAADSVFRIALSGEKELGSNLGQAINYANIGAIFETKGKNDSAMVYYTLSLEHNIRAKSGLGIALCYINFGRLYEHNQLWDKAIEKYKKAYFLMGKKGDKWHWLEASIALTRIYIEKGELNNAEKALSEAQHVAEKIGSKEHLASIHNLYYRLYERQENHAAALKSYILSNAYEDSISGTQEIAHMQNIRIKYERERAHYEISDIRQQFVSEQSAKRSFIGSTIVSLVLLAIVIALLIYTIRVRSHSQRMQHRLEEIRTSFFTNITHEFRTPLTVILGMGHHMETGSLPAGETMQSWGSAIVRQGNSLLNLINQLLDIFKVKSAIGEPDWRTGNIVVYLRMITESFISSARQKGIMLGFSSTQLEITMDFVPDYIQKIIHNLLSNAIKYTPKSGTIYVSVRSEADQLVLQVADNGAGIAPEDQPYIFQPFYQGKNSNSNIGTGVGLSLVSLIVKSMNGDIGIESSPGRGSTFTVTLPLRHGKSNWPLYIAEKDQTALLSNSIGAEVTNTNDEENRPLVLIIEDNADVAHYIGLQLCARHKVEYEIDGAAGLAKAEASVPDLIITDLMLPGIDGYEICRRVRSSEIISHIPIIVVTARATEEDRIKGIESGADAYLYKPFNADELKVRVEKLLEQRRRLRDTYTKAGLTDRLEDNFKNDRERDFLNRFGDIIRQHMSEGDLTNDTLAGYMGMSVSQLRRKIFALTGDNISIYVVRVRISKAKILLKGSPQLKVGEVAARCGYYDISHFSKTFKQECGMTPTQYRYSH